MAFIGFPTEPQRTLRKILSDLRAFVGNYFVTENWWQISKDQTKDLVKFLKPFDKEINELIMWLREFGGTMYSKPATVQGWMYGCAFIDLDGHRWNVLHMDMSKMPKQ